MIPVEGPWRLFMYVLYCTRSLQGSILVPSAMPCPALPCPALRRLAPGTGPSPADSGVRWGGLAGLAVVGAWRLLAVVAHSVSVSGC
jgi:hypothetical protein